jgi:hypothetical protein
MKMAGRAAQTPCSLRTGVLSRVKGTVARVRDDGKRPATTLTGNTKSSMSEKTSPFMSS